MKTTPEELTHLYQLVRSKTPGDIRHTIADRAFHARLEAAIKHLKKRCKELGYTHLTIGPSPHWPGGGGNNDMLFAEPKRRHNGWPAIWSASNEVFEGACGNGFKNADQKQVRISFPPMYRGRFEL